MEKAVFISVSLFLVLLHPVLTAKGIDVSTLVSKSDFSCLKGEGYDFLIVRGYRSTGEPDPDAAATIANAKAAGIENADVYMFPCPKCSKSAGEQVNDMGKDEYLSPYTSPPFALYPSWGCK